MTSRTTTTSSTSPEELLRTLLELLRCVEIAPAGGGRSERAAQYALPPKSTAYIGCVGNDDLADQLRAANDKEGLHSAYQVLPRGADSTGACAVVITGHNRYARPLSDPRKRSHISCSSLCTKLGAAEKFSPAHLESAEVKPLIESAQFYYLGGFFLTHGVQSALSLARQSAKAEKVRFLVLLRHHSLK